MHPRSPGDARDFLSGALVLIGGRVLSVAGATLVVADALGVVEVRLRASGETPGGADVTTAREGDLVVVEGRWDGAALVEAHVTEGHRPARHDVPGGDVRRLLLGGVGARLTQRARVIAALRGHLLSAGFCEVETPAVVPCPGLDLHLDGCAADGGYLITSPEYQMKRLLAGGLPRIFQLARCFRRGEQGRMHNPEFTMLEWYRAFAGHEDIMADTEALVRAAARAVGDVEKFSIEGRTIDLAPPFVRVTVAEAFAQHAGVGVDELLRLSRDDEDTYFRLMVEQVEPALASLDRPVFLMDYPAAQASLARRKPADPRFAERFELYVAGVELCNGFGELTDPGEQRHRLLADQAERARRGLPVYPLDERFLQALDEGMPPSGGNALGVDRLVALACGAASLGQIQAFPAPEL